MCVFAPRNFANVFRLLVFPKLIDTLDSFPYNPHHDYALACPIK